MKNTFSGETTDDWYYCPPSPTNDPLIEKTHVSNYIKDITIVVFSLLRLVFSIYVLVRVCHSSKNGFWSRHIFMTVLPILMLIFSAVSLSAGVYILLGTIKG